MKKLTVKDIQRAMDSIDSGDWKEEFKQTLERMVAECRKARVKSRCGEWGLL